MTWSLLNLVTLCLPCFPPVLCPPIYLCSITLTSQNAALNYQGSIKITRGLLSCFCLRMAFCCKKKQGIFFTERNETTIGCHLFYLLGNLNCWRWSCLCISQDYQKLLELTVKYYILKTEHIRTGRHLGKGLFNSPQQKSELIQNFWPPPPPRPFLDSSEFFKGHQLVKKAGLKAPPPPPFWTSPDFCRGELNDPFPYYKARCTVHGLVKSGSSR